MQLSTRAGSQRSFLVDVTGVTKKVVRNKNTGQSFWVRGRSGNNVELVPIQGEDLLVPENQFTAESWEVIH